MRKLMFALLILLGFGVPVLAQEDAEPIAYGDVVEATQGSNDGDYWVFEGAEGDMVNIDMISADFDTFVELFNEDGDQLAFNDDTAGDFGHSRIIFALPEDGSYFILAHSFANNARREEYTLSLTLVDPERVLAYGDEAEGRVTDDIGEAWVFFGVEDDVVTISLDSDVIDTYVELFDPSGVLLDYNDDHGGTLDSEISDVTLPADGMYTIVARSFAGGSNGAYTIVLQGEEGERTRGGDDDDSVTIAGDQQGEIELGSVVEGNITTEAGDVWTFTAEEDDIILIAMNNPSTDCYLELYGPDGDMLLSDDDGGIGYNAALLLGLPDDGEYTIVTRGFAGGTGAYTMSLVVLEEIDELIVGSVNSANDVNLRDGVDGEVVDSTYPADYFLLIGRSEDSSWLQIASVDDDPLWISASLVTIEDFGTSEDIEDLPVTG